ncbi:hypothetical protein P834_06292 [Citrobacter freundii UCI 31]|nr:hypothetical protein P834_06292 [Citrobacter freundii UCI 31]
MLLIIRCKTVVLKTRKYWEYIKDGGVLMLFYSNFKSIFINML